MLKQRGFEHLIVLTIMLITSWCTCCVIADRQHEWNQPDISHVHRDSVTI